MEYRLNSEEIYKAAKILKIPERATMREIREQYRKLARKWHPDNCKDEREVCENKIKEIVRAYRLVMDYCRNYQYSFKKDEIIQSLPSKNRYREEWIKQFGNDPLWGR